MILRLRDFLHLPQLDVLVSQLISENSGLILLAGIDSRLSPSENGEIPGAGNLEMIAPSGLSALFSILIQEILLERPDVDGMVVAKDRGVLRVPPRLKRKLSYLPVDEEHSFSHQIEMAAKQRPGVLVIDHLDVETAPQAFSAAGNGLRVITQFDTVLHGSAILSQMIDLGIPREQLKNLRWILTVQRIPVLCPHCKRAIPLSQDLADKLINHYPHLRNMLLKIKDLTNTPQDGRGANTQPGFFKAHGCDHCHGSGYQGDLSVFDIYRNEPGGNGTTEPISLLSLEENAFQLASEGQLDLNDLLNLEKNHLRRIYHMLTTSERSLQAANAELTRKLFELQAANRVLLQRTEVLMSLEDMGKALISSSSLNDLALRVCRRASELCGADRVVLYLRRLFERTQETAEILAVSGWDGSSIGKQVTPDLIFGPEVLNNKVSRFSKVPPGIIGSPDEASNENSKHNLAMGMRLPLFTQDQLVGVMIIQCTHKEYFSPGESALLHTFANQAALAIQRAGLVDDLRGKIIQLETAQAELVKKERMEREMELARQVQQSMLPHSFPAIPGFLIAGKYEPARQVGGDFYDVILLDDNHFGIVIADVSDKGMPAALYMALVRSLIHAEARREHSPRSTLINVNRSLLELGELSGFVSVFYGIVDQKTLRMEYSRAGHERPLLLRDGQVLSLPANGAVLGILDGDDLKLDQAEIFLEPHDRLILFTDGLVDVANEHGEFFGSERLNTLVKSLEGKPIYEVCQTLFEGLANFRGKIDQFDDMTLLVLEILQG